MKSRIAGAVLLVFTAALWGAPVAAAPAGPLTAPTGCVTSQLTLAPALASDRNPDGTRVAVTPDRRGKFTPIVMVHGWTGTDVHNDARTGNFSHKIDLTANRVGTARTDRSLIGQLQRLGGTAVYTFDYHDYSARWVDDSHIGPALGTAIECLFRESGQKVILVGHSMGGLAARYAVTQPGTGGADRAKMVSTVVTFGTPQLGSLIALLADGGLNTAAAAGLLHGDLILPLLHLFLSQCGTQASDRPQTGSVCDFLPPPARAFDSDAGRALRYGSAQLAALKPWPKGITVDALAGHATFTVPKAGWFNLPWETTPVPLGDVIVTAGSAVHGASLTKQVNCSYQLNAVRGATDNLMRTVELTNEALGAINDDLIERQDSPCTAAGIAGDLSVATEDVTGVSCHDGWAVADVACGQECTHSGQLLRLVTGRWKDVGYVVQDCAEHLVQQGMPKGVAVKFFRPCFGPEPPSAAPCTNRAMSVAINKGTSNPYDVDRFACRGEVAVAFANQSDNGPYNPDFGYFAMTAGGSSWTSHGRARTPQSAEDFNRQLRPPLTEAQAQTAFALVESL